MENTRRDIVPAGAKISTLALCRGLLIEWFYRVSAQVNLIRGVNREKRTTPVLVSLTSIEQRLPTLGLCIESLLQQSLKPDYIILWLSDSLKGHRLPKVLLKQMKRGLEIRYCKGLGPFSKIFYSLREYPGYIIATCDDDIIYPVDWLAKLYKAYLRCPEHIYCYRARLLEKDPRGGLKKYMECENIKKESEPSLRVFPLGTGGVLYPPRSLYKEVLNEELYSALCPKCDDVWLKAMSLLQRTLCKKIVSSSIRQHQIFGSQHVSLWAQNKTANDEAIQNVFSRFDIYKLF